MSLPPRIESIVRKLGQVRERGLRCFGSDAHEFLLGPPLGEAEILAFEREHGIELPREYRAFLRDAGHGGAGPYYGLFPLDRWSDAAGWMHDDVPADWMRRPCPLGVGPTEVDRDTHLRLDPSPYQGTLSLGSQGCTHVTQLIVTGAQRGRVLYFEIADGHPYVSREPDFLSWYERWLDELLAGYATSWFGFGPRGGAAEWLAILGDAAAEPALRGEAAEAFLRLPSVDSGVVESLSHFLADSDPRVRSGAAAAIAQFGTSDSAVHDRIARLLDDDALQPRIAAVRALMALDAPRFLAPVRARIAASEAELGLAAFHALDRAGGVDDDLRRWAARDAASPSVRALAARSIDWMPDDLALCLELLDTPQTRAQGLEGIAKLVPRELAPRVISTVDREPTGNVRDQAIRVLGLLGDPAAGEVLLRLLEHGDDFERLCALEALSRLGDLRLLPFAERMLTELRSPERRSERSFSSHIKTIAELARAALDKSSSKRIRRLT